MSFAVEWDTEAIGQASAFLEKDPQGLQRVLAAVDGLLSEPRPPQAFAFGETGIVRLRAGDYRVLYKIEGDVIAIRRIARL